MKLENWGVIIAWVALMSVTTFLVMWRDKRAAVGGRWRTPEALLHSLALLGGWPGTLAAQRLLRHKNRKLRFRLILWLIIALHLSLAAGTIWFMYVAS